LDATIVAEEGLRIFLPASEVIVEHHDWLLAVLAVAVGPLILDAGRSLTLVLKKLNGGLVAMDDLLEPQPQLQGVIEAIQVPHARPYHPMAQCTTAAKKSCALEGLRQTIKGCAIDVFMNEGRRA
jgi:hypothetical protein